MYDRYKRHYVDYVQVWELNELAVCAVAQLVARERYISMYVSSEE
ncbi:MAG: hypothetical protein QXH24_04595 [Candidatus Bathyarchaeia archaeon]